MLIRFVRDVLVDGEHCAAGDEREVDDQLAGYLIRHGRAVVVGAPETAEGGEAAETADGGEAAETADAPPAGEKAISRITKRPKGQG